ncbi:MAG: sugar ABC transporter permease [Anaerolineae bacterium]|jgi:arabinogalactan oligomer/maltooligosaccharide transport system permease protein
MASVATPRKEGFLGRAAWNLWESRQAYIYILPAFIIMAFITFYPIGYQVWMAFTNFRLEHLRTQNPDVIGFQNFVQILRSGLPVPNFNFGRILVFNIVWTFVNVFLHAALGIMIALALNSDCLPGKRFYRSLFVIPWALPALVSGMVWHNMWHERFGAINLLLQEIGIAGNIRWLLETDPVINLPQIGLVLPLSFFAVLIANVWLGWPFMMVIATGALQSIPQELYEAAEVDGASGWQQLWRITLPLLRPAMVPAIMIGIMMTFNQFNVIYFVTGGGPIGLTEILVTQGFKLVNPQGWYGVAAAFNIIVFIILAIITLVTNRISQATEPYYA